MKNEDVKPSVITTEVISSDGDCYIVNAGAPSFSCQKVPTPQFVKPKHEMNNATSMITPTSAQTGHGIASSSKSAVQPTRSRKLTIQCQQRTNAVANTRPSGNANTATTFQASTPKLEQQPNAHLLSVPVAADSCPSGNGSAVAAHQAFERSDTQMPLPQTDAHLLSVPVAADSCPSGNGSAVATHQAFERSDTQMPLPQSISECPMLSHSYNDEDDITFEIDVQTLLDTFVRTERAYDALEFLASLPSYCNSIEQGNPEATLDEFNRSLEGLLSPYVSSTEAVEVQLPMFKCCFYPLAVLFEAMSRSTSMPATFYTDASCLTELTSCMGVLPSPLGGLTNSLCTSVLSRNDSIGWVTESSAGFSSESSPLSSSAVQQAARPN